MQFVLRTGDGERELHLDAEVEGAATIGDLAVALDPDAVTEGFGVYIDRQLVDQGVPLEDSPLVNGSVVEFGSSARQRPQQRSPFRSGGSELAIVGGLRSGHRHPVAAQVLTLGRDPSADIRIDDPTVSPMHVMMRLDGEAVEVEDLGSHNGTFIGDRALTSRQSLDRGEALSLGAVEVVLRTAEVDDRPVGLDPCTGARHGAFAFNRPPRSVLGGALVEIPVPDGPVAAARNVAFSFVALLGPIIAGAVMVKLMGNIRYGLFALMSPVMLVTNYVATRRRHSRESKTSERRFKRELEQFRLQLDESAQSERSRRETLFPDPAEIMRRAALPSTRLWERRFTDPDFLHLRIGRGAVAWSPPVDERRVASAVELGEVVAEASSIGRCAVTLDLSAGGVVGLVGDRLSALSLARSLVAQACVLHGPADMALMVLTAGPAAGDWDWAKWLPNCRAPRGAQRFLSSGPDSSRGLMEAVLGKPRAEAQGPVIFVVVDDESLTVGRDSPTRLVLAGRAGPVAGLVVASSADRLPAVCSSVVHLRDDLGDGELVYPQLGQRVPHIGIAGITEGSARSLARDLARFEDPELAMADGGIPSTVSLLRALGMDDVDPGRVLREWQRSTTSPRLRMPVGSGVDGVVEVDLVADGPHALVGGTTGSGKSELLRSLVAGMATRLSPHHLVFVLIDYKGGSAFDDCAKLPHTVGMVTDLDAHLGERALRSLEAELRHRERLLRSAGAADLQEYLSMGAPSGPMPRMVIVVDEFATMAAELPDFIGALVGVAQRGRSLGVHMILATQRPSGVVDANIKANTNIRIALRMHDAQDSIDVIECLDASTIPRSSPGLAYIRLGPGELHPVQTSFSSGVTDPELGGQLAVRPFRFGLTPAVCRPVESEGRPTDLERLVRACVAAFDELREATAPRRPWIDMLSEHIELADLVNSDPQLGPGEIILGLADDPDRQAQPPFSWSPTSENLGFVGATGSGTTSAIVTTALSAAYREAPDLLHVYCLDSGGGSLGCLDGLPHVGAVVGAHETERQARLITTLSDEVRRRRSMAGPRGGNEPQILLLIDGLASLLSQFSGADGHEPVDRLKRLMAEGPGVGVATVVSVDRSMSVPMAVMGAVSRRILLKQLDAGDFAMIGVRPHAVPDLVPGRAIDSESKLVVQLGFASDPQRLAADISQRWDQPARPPLAIAALPSEVSTGEMAAHLHPGEPTMLPVGISEGDHSVASLALYPGEHVFVGGSARSGVSTTLRALARLLKKADSDAVMVAVAGARSSLWRDVDLYDAIGPLQELGHVLEVAADGDGRQWVVVVDDAHLIDESLHLAEVVRSTDHCRVLAGGRSDDLHGRFNHWTRLVRRCGTGLLLQPRLEADGDLLGVRLPRRVVVPLVPGRGFLVAQGESSLVQVAGADLAVA